jgi:hypothetical protein
MKRRCPHCGETFPRWGITLNCPLCGASLADESFRRAVPMLRVLAGIALAAIVIGFVGWLVWVIAFGG